MEISSLRGSQLFKMMTGYFQDSEIQINDIYKRMTISFITCLFIAVLFEHQRHELVHQQEEVEQRGGGLGVPQRVRLRPPAPFVTGVHAWGRGRGKYLLQILKNILPIPLRSLPDIPLEKGVRDSDFILTGNCRMAPI